MNQGIDSVFDLSRSEKLQLVEDLWGDLAAIPSEVPTADWQVEQLERRQANLKSHPAPGLDGEKVKRRIRTRSSPLIV